MKTTTTTRKEKKKKNSGNRTPTLHAIDFQAVKAQRPQPERAKRAGECVRASKIKHVYRCCFAYLFI